MGTIVIWFILLNILKGYSTKCAGHWDTNKIPAARNSFSSRGGWHGDRHAQENEVCVRWEVLTGKMGRPRKATLPEDFQASHGRHGPKAAGTRLRVSPGHSGS